MNKFGIKYTKFSRSMIDNPIIYPIKSIRGLQFFGHLEFNYFDAAAEVPCTPYGNLETEDGVALRKYWFVEDPNEDNFHALLPFFFNYVAVHNIYGGILDLITDAAADNVCFVICSAINNSGVWTATHVFNDAILQIVLSHYGIWTQTDTINVSIGGTSTAAVTDLTFWQYAEDMDAKYAYLFKTDEQKAGVMIAYCINAMF